MRLCLIALAACGPATTVHPERAAPTCDNDATLATQADLAGLAGCASLHNLTIAGPGNVQLEPLGRLTQLTGDLVVRGVDLDKLALPRLARVAGAILVVDNAKLRAIAMPALEHAARLEVTGNAQLATIDVGQATFDAIEVSDNAVLPAEVVDRIVDRSRGPGGGG